jgi:hypothetical protein
MIEAFYVIAGPLGRLFEGRSLLSDAISRQNEDMAEHNGTPAGEKNGHPSKRPITPLGKELLKLREKYIASGGKLLNRRELEREVAERRGSR